MNFGNLNAGQVTTLVTAFLSAVMDALTAFNVFHFSDLQKSSVLLVATAGVAVGLYLFASFSHQKALLAQAQAHQVVMQQLNHQNEMERQAAADAAWPIPPVSS